MAWTPAYAGPGPSKVGGLGDSIMALTWDELAVKFTASPWRWAGACYPGLKCSDIVANGWPRDLAATSPQHVVVIAGTNDCFRPDTEWNLTVPAAQAQLIDAFPTSTRIHWVKVYANPPAGNIPPGCSLQAHVQGWNQALANWAGQRPNLRLVDWPACVFWFSAQGVVMLDGDGIHPTATGQALLAHIVATSVAGP